MHIPSLCLLGFRIRQTWSLITTSPRIYADFQDLATAEAPLVTPEAPSWQGLGTGRSPGALIQTRTFTSQTLVSHRRFNPTFRSATE